ncbi:hypothetical protein K505DRAFT_54726 [Melanomma pulvis-pyrius CBS 109.77]|uniref:Uncharacterized protein n=1 Tax=Melanomma pulvis-pyrius CBS 109.77 TaxID=1314802 RepID=A0A6A6X8N2_9PLEO|nr:hypothetical protein K505DRAFT_54726 [Melanomma pulvis-pyrius CBS 109.77]
MHQATSLPGRCNSLVTTLTLMLYVNRDSNFPRFSTDFMTASTRRISHPRPLERSNRETLSGLYTSKVPRESETRFQHRRCGESFRVWFVATRSCHGSPRYPFLNCCTLSTPCL